jgi:hypothetical protein
LRSGRRFDAAAYFVGRIAADLQSQPKRRGGKVGTLGDSRPERDEEANDGQDSKDHLKGPSLHAEMTLTDVNFDV